MADDLYECPEHRVAFRLSEEPCWPCWVRAMYAGAASGHYVPIPNDRLAWAALEGARRTWRPVNTDDGR